MTSYIIEIKKCPDCNCEFIRPMVASCNTFDAKFYTDCFIWGPMYDEGSALLICPGCHKYFWCEDVSTTQSIPESKYFNDSELKSLPFSSPLSIGFCNNRYEDVLRKKIWKNIAQEKYIRIRAWWAFNNTYRDDKTKSFDISAEQKENFLRLLILLDDNDIDTSIKKAEILRQLGRFDECLKELDSIPDDTAPRIAGAIKRLAICKKRQVEILKD